MGYKIRVTPLGAKDLEEIVTYMTQELDNADAAASFLDEVDACYARMEEMPFLFEECPIIPSAWPISCTATA